MDEPKGPNDKPNGRESEGPGLQKISPEQLKQILENHRKWVESEMKEGERADLRDTNLVEANLQKAILLRANLHSANL